MKTPVLVVALLAAGCASAPPPEVLGAYRFDDGRLISVRRSLDDTLRYRVYQNGESRRLYPRSPLEYVSGPGFAVESPVDLVVRFDPEASLLTWRTAAAPPATARRVGRDEWARFASDGTSLLGRLSLPAGAGPFAAVVLVHGSGSDAATESYPNADFYAANGMAALTFDKRGTGSSEGELTMDFHRLARDVVAAVEWLRARDEIDPARIGLTGYSQGGWVGPLAACLSPHVRFAVVSYGMIESPAEEARMETRNLLRKRGVDAAGLDQLDELTTAAVRVVATGFADGWGELARAKARYADAPWLDQLEGTTVGQLVRYPAWLVKWIGPLFDLEGLRWYYDSGELLERSAIPMVWLFAGADQSAPHERTLPRLRALRDSGKPYELEVFPGVDHGMLEFDEDAGVRRYTGYAPRYFRTEVESARRLAEAPAPVQRPADAEGCLGASLPSNEHAR